MSNIIENSQFYKIIETVVRVKEFDFLAIGETIEEYLSIREIAGTKYDLYSVYSYGQSIQFTMRISDECDGYEKVDENFSSDDGFKEFCNIMTEKVGVKSFGVPYWYYGK